MNCFKIFERVASIARCLEAKGFVATDCMTTMEVRTEVAEYTSTQSMLSDPCVATVV